MQHDAGHRSLTTRSQTLLLPGFIFPGPSDRSARSSWSSLSSSLASESSSPEVRFGATFGPWRKCTVPNYLGFVVEVRRELIDDRWGAHLMCGARGGVPGEKKSRSSGIIVVFPFSSLSASSTSLVSVIAHRRMGPSRTILSRIFYGNDIIEQPVLVFCK